MTPVIDVRGLSYRYPDGQSALQDVSFTLDEGQTLAIIGPNGAGKSTLLLLLVGLLTPRDGVVKVLGMPVNAASVKQVRRAVGLVFQDPEDQLFCPLVFDDVAFGPLNLGLPEAEVRETVRRSLELVGMAGCEQRPPHHLSLGEKKRVALAWVLATKPRLLLLDEPTASLDPAGRWEATALIRGLPGAKIVVTHDLELAGELADIVMVMDMGAAVAIGEAWTILSDRQLLAAHKLARHPEAVPAVRLDSRGGNG